MSVAWHDRNWKRNTRKRPDWRALRRLKQEKLGRKVLGLGNHDLTLCSFHRGNLGLDGVMNNFRSLYYLVTLMIICHCYFIVLI